MHILKIVIDGFKSYADRTEIGPFDKHFNAITGYNGSGKSNILDAICFVLGTTSWGQMRASNSLELIYKQGAGAIKKASVSITFDNTDKSRSPMQYIDQDYITVTRQVTVRAIKYKINGKTSQVSEVHNLFHSVQLNINNPHFLIMQGHITKVLNMKPKDILGLLEEASGTRMFESKKASVRKRIEGHESKVEGINRTLSETINPTLEKMNREKASYTKYLGLKSKCNELERNLVACQYALAHRQIENLTRKIEESRKDPQWSEEGLESRQRELEKLQNEYNDFKSLQAEKDAPLRDTEERKAKLTLKLKSKQLESSRVLKDSNKEEEALVSLQSQEKDLNETLVKKKNDLSSQKQQLQVFERQLLALEAIQSGNNSTVESGKIEEQVMCTQKELTEIDAELTKLEREIEEVQRKLQEIQKDLKDSDKNKKFNKTKTEYTQAKTELNNLAKELEAYFNKINHSSLLAKEEALFAKQYLSGFKEGSDNKNNSDLSKLLLLPLDKRVELRLKALESLYMEFREKMNSLDKNLTQHEQETLKRTNFEYEPSTNLDPRKVFGQICRLVTIKEEDKAQGLSIAGGGRWNHVVVEGSNEAMLLTKLAKRRTTFVMLKEIQCRTPDEKSFIMAKQLVGEGNVWMAQYLVGIPPRYKAALDYVLSDTLITRDGNMAQKITFNEKVARSVSMAGDVYDLQGTITGGEESEKKEPLLLTLSKLEIREAKKIQIQESMKLFEEQIQKLQNIFNQWTIVNNQVLGLEQRLQFQQDPSVILSQLESRLSELMSQRDSKKLAKESADNFLYSLNSAFQGKKKQDKDRQGGQQNMKQVNLNIKKAQNTIVRLEAELNEIEKDLESIRAGQLEASKSIQMNKSNLAQLEFEKIQIQNQLTEAEDFLQKIISEVHSHHKHMKQLKAQVDEIHLVVTNWSRKMKSYMTQLNEDQAKLEKSQSRAKELSSRYPGLNAQIQNYPIIEHELIQRISQETQALDIAKDELKRIIHSVNPKAAQLADQFEKEVEELRKKKNIIEDDRDAIEATIREFDQRKLSTLQKAYDSVSLDFRDVFSSLAPGLNASLEKVSDKIQEGLCIQVQLGSRIASLSELSGGQRSLLALSLVLSLLKYNPAPMYILDEVDSALDNSNTQNIGLIFKEKFPQSQFIVISLKQDLLSSANVLFSVRFDSKIASSVVTRTTPGKAY